MIVYKIEKTINKWKSIVSSCKEFFKSTKSKWLSFLFGVVTTYLLGCWLTLDFKCYETVFTRDSYGGPFRYFTMLMIVGFSISWYGWTFKSKGK